MQDEPVEPNTVEPDAGMEPDTGMRRGRGRRQEPARRGRGRRQLAPETTPRATRGDGEEQGEVGGAWRWAATGRCRGR